jgi:alcohol dehydrogenase
MTMKMRAAVLDRMQVPTPYAQTRPVSVESVELGEPGPGEVLVRITAAGLCHSDLSIINGDRPRPLPMVLGHEAAGVVESCGPGVRDLVRGDAVALVFVPSCGHCLPCQEGRPALCEPGAAANAAGTLVGGHRLLVRPDDQLLNHQVGVSCFAEYAVVNRGSLVKVVPDLPPEVAAIFGCAVLTGVGAALNSAAIRLGQSVAVVGLGGVGLSALLGALAAGAREVVALDIVPEKLELALALGATRALRADDPDVVTRLRSEIPGGVDVAIEAASAVAALEVAWKLTRRGGTTVTCSLPNPAHHLQVPVVQMTAEERTLKGSYLGSAVPARDIPRYIQLYRAGRLPVDRLITHRLELDDINAGFDRLAAGAAVRQVILF